MTDSELLEKIQDIMRDILDLDDLVISKETSADDVEEWDSLSNINIVVAMEKEFGVKFALGELQQLQNIGEMIDLLHEKGM